MDGDFTVPAADASPEVQAQFTQRLQMARVPFDRQADGSYTITTTASGPVSAAPGDTVRKASGVISVIEPE